MTETAFTTLAQIMPKVCLGNQSNLQQLHERRKKKLGMFVPLTVAAYLPAYFVLIKLINLAHRE